MAGVSPGTDSPSDAGVVPDSGVSLLRCRVVLPLPAGPFDYVCPATLCPERGAVVRVPLGPREQTGVIQDSPRPLAVPEPHLRRIRARLPCPPLPGALLDFLAWAAAYTVFPPGSFLKLCLPVPEALMPEVPGVLCVPAPAPAFSRRPTALQQRVLALAAATSLPPDALAARAECSAGVIRRLLDGGQLLLHHAPPDAPDPVPDPARPGPVLRPEQASAAAALARAVTSGETTPFLLQGVTGSGKTEVCFEAIRTCLEQGRQALVLLPEISLSAAWLDRFRACFGVAPHLWHSSLSRAVRRRTWRDVLEGRARVVAGARSALFLPLARPGLIVVDEEHDDSYRQGDGVTYHARDLAVVRASMAGASLVLASATPSVESVVNVRRGRYRLLELRERHGGQGLPAVHLIDLRRDRPPRGSCFSRRLREAVAETLAAGDQVLLYLNRRGYAPLTLCDDCGKAIACPHCDIPLVMHRGTAHRGTAHRGAAHRDEAPARRQTLKCHYCGYSRPLPARCPETTCRQGGSLSFFGAGIERVSQEAATLFPEARILALSSDLQARENLAERLQEIIRHEHDLIIGTRIVAKGHHFPALVMAGIIDGDPGFDGGDFRATGRACQVLTQVAGRAGRGDRPGRVFVQLCHPEHASAAALASGRMDLFMEEEIRARQLARMPPFSRLAALIVSGREQARTLAVARQLAATAPEGEGVEVMGPVPAPLARIAGRYRFRLLLRTTPGQRPSRLLPGWLARVPAPRGIRIRADVDPYDFL